MAVNTFIECAPHEGDLHLIFDEYGLKPYFAMNQIRRDHDGWKYGNKPTRNIKFDGDRWALCYDYDINNGLDPWMHPDYKFQPVPEFRFYFVAKDGLYKNNRGDQSSRIRGGTITVRPRKPGMTSDGESVQIPNLGGPYIDVQVQASNIRHDLYHQLAIEIISAFDVNSKYLQNPHETSNWNDAAVYVRIQRGESGTIYAADGPIARSHQLLEADREGYRRHKEDHRKLPGYDVSTHISDQRSHNLIKGHSLGKEIKHYYSQYPEGREPDDPLYHPKLEVSYQTNITEETVYWSDTEDMVRELEETLLNTLEWAELPLRGGDPFYPDEYFSAEDGQKRSRKLVDCPLPEIKDAQEAAVMSLWGSTTQSDKDVLDLLLTNGGEISPQEAAEKTGYTYRTIRNVADRCKSVIRHTYDKLEIRSKYQRDLLLNRIRAREQDFREAIEDAVLTAAEAATDRLRSKWSQVRRKYNITVDNDPSDCRKLVKVRYEPEDTHEARNVIKSIKNAYLATHDDRGGAHGVHAVIQLEDGTRRRYKNLKAKTIAPRRGSKRARKFKQKIESVSDEEWEQWRRGLSVISEAD